MRAPRPERVFAQHALLVEMEALVGVGGHDDSAPQIEAIKRIPDPPAQPAKHLRQKFNSKDKQEMFHLFSALTIIHGIEKKRSHISWSIITKKLFP